MTTLAKEIHSNIAITAVDTVAVRAGIESDSQYGAITPPLYLSSNFSFAGFDDKREYDYSRSGNPTRDLLGKAIADLEGGFDAVVTSSGMSAIFCVLQLLKSDDRVVAPHDCYGGTFRLLKSYADKGLITLDFVDQTDAAALQNALDKKPKIIWVETPSNPLLRVVDIKDLSTKAKQVDALLVVDNTFLSPVFQKPISLGADIVVHSTTKYINGHSDVVGGAVVAKNQALFEDLKWWANCTGITGAPFDSFLALRGLRTLDVRVKRHASNAAKIVDYLVASSQVEHVYYPGLVGHPGHEIAKAQQSGFGSMITFKLKGNLDKVKLFLKQLNAFSLAESLGGVESLICHPKTMTHAAVSIEEQATAGITENLLRLSVGIENIDDLIDDLDNAFASINSIQTPSVAV